MKVEEIRVDKPDSAGVIVESVYARVPPNYAIYRTAERVMVHWADDEVLSSTGQPLGSEQRQMMAQLAPLRGEINGHLAKWRIQSDPELDLKHKMYDRRIADALQLALQGDPIRAEQLLTAIRDDLVSDRSSTVRSSYLGAATVSAMVIIAVMSFLDANWFVGIYSFSPVTKVLWFGAGVGALGALFSIALSIRDRSIPINFLMRDNLVDAGLRIFIGSVSAAILFALLMSEAVEVKIGSIGLVPAVKGKWELAQPIAITIAFVAGFVERLASDLLGRTVVAAFNSAGTKTAEPASLAASAMRSRPSDESDPLGRKPAMVATPTGAASAPQASEEIAPDDDQAEGCLADHDHAGDSLTQDVELPETMGGVEQK